MARAARWLTSWLVLVGVAGVLGCRTVPIPASLPTITVPQGLTARDVEVAILAGIRNKSAAVGYDPLVPPANFERFVFASYMTDPPGNSWFPESLQPGTVIAAVDTRGHYLEVALKYDTSAIRTELLQSRNLLQENGRIHKKALAWIANLHEHIQRELNRLARLRMGPSPEPASSPG
ncbi:MAG TPA: hypothetical protein VMR86_03325 [Myxococcota bacterium]|nr:hypothetical protein [Myxococcota bacterium]